MDFVVLGWNFVKGVILPTDSSKLSMDDAYSDAVFQCGSGKFLIPALSSTILQLLKWHVGIACSFWENWIGKSFLFVLQLVEILYPTLNQNAAQNFGEGKPPLPPPKKSGS